MVLTQPDQSSVVISAREFKDALLARESRQQIEMTRAWLAVEKTLEADIVAMSGKIEQIIRAGQEVTRAEIARFDQFKKLISEAQDQTAKYASGFVDPFIETGQAEIIDLAVAQATNSVENSLVGIGANFPKLNPGALESLVGTAGSGQPLGELVKRSVRFGVGDYIQVLDTLYQATARGYNPAKTANLIKGSLTGGLNKALLISRSEQLRAYRSASQSAYQASGVVNGYLRISARDARVCSACLMADGTFYPLADDFPEHPQGRCTLVPVVNGAKPPQWQKGKEWFQTQPEDVQKQIMGSGQFDAWKAGKFELEDLVTENFSAEWGRSLTPTPLKSLVPPEIPKIDIVPPDPSSSLVTEGFRSGLPVADAENLAAAMDLTSDESVAMLERVGLTKSEALAGIDEARIIQGKTPNTKDLHLLADGTYTVERQALHDNIVDQFLSEATPENNPRMFMTGGLPGSGKSTVLNGAAYTNSLDNMIQLDSDSVKALLAAEDGIDNLGALAMSYHTEADDILDRIMIQAVENKQSIGLDLTMKTEKKIVDLVDLFSSAGYSTEIAFVDVDPKASMTRAIGRYLNGGRFVDPAYIASHDMLNAQTAMNLKENVDVFRFWDNNVAFGDSPILKVGFEVVDDISLTGLVEIQASGWGTTDIIKEITVSSLDEVKLYQADLGSAIELVGENADGTFFVKYNSNAAPAELFEDYIENLPPKQFEGLDLYRNEYHEPINEYARFGELSDNAAETARMFDPSQSLPEMLNNMDEAIALSPGLQDDAVLWRGIDDFNFYNDLDNGVYAVGEVLSDKGFTSTTFSEKVADGFATGKAVKYKILTPSGTAGIYMESLSELGSQKIAGEFEFLLPRNTSMEVIEIVKDPIDGAYTLTMQITN